MQMNASYFNSKLKTFRALSVTTDKQLTVIDVLLICRFILTFQKTTILVYLPKILNIYMVYIKGLI